VGEKIEQWLALAAWERWVLVQLMLLLPLIGLSLSVLGLKRTSRLLGGTGCLAAGGSEVNAEARTLAERIARSVNIAARHGPYKATCLRKSLALLWLLRTRGVAAELRIGVRLNEGVLDAHAWVEHAGVPINGESDVAEEFAPFRATVAHL
jgi:hypothetical protein